MILSSTTVFTIDHFKKCFLGTKNHIRMISEAPWATEEWSNNYAITGINYNRKHSNCTQYFNFYCIFDRINAALLRILDFIRNIKKSYQLMFWMLIIYMLGPRIKIIQQKEKFCSLQSNLIMTNFTCRGHTDNTEYEKSVFSSGCTLMIVQLSNTY